MEIIMRKKVLFILSVLVLLDSVCIADENYDFVQLCINGDTGAIEKAINSGANINAMDKQKQTALHHAVVNI
jgi:hypothetical protein